MNQRTKTFLTAVATLLFGGVFFASQLGAAPPVNILGRHAVVGTGLTATTTANANLTASGTVAFITLATTTSPCLTVDSNGVIGTIGCSTTAFTTTTINGLSSTAYTFATSGAPGLTIQGAGSTLTFLTATSSASATGFLSSADWTTFNNKQSTISFPLAVASTSLAVDSSLLLQTNTLRWNPVQSTSTITTATTTNLYFTAATGTTLGFVDGTKLTTGFKSFGFNVLNATTTATATTTIQKQLYQAITITQIDCSTNGASITIGADERASSTPDTLGTDVFNGGSLVCDSNGNSTSTFANADIASLAVLNFDLDSASNSTTTLRVTIKFKEQ